MEDIKLTYFNKKAIKKGLSMQPELNITYPPLYRDLFAPWPIKYETRKFGFNAQSHQTPVIAPLTAKLIIGTVGQSKMTENLNPPLHHSYEILYMFARFSIAPFVLVLFFHSSIHYDICLR